VYSQADRQRLSEFGDRVYVSPLIFKVPQPSIEQVTSWREEWDADRSGDIVVLFAGFLCPDKRLDLLIESARSWPSGRRLAVVGEDRGAWEQCVRIADTCNVRIASRIGFVSFIEFAAAIAAADLVVVPYEQVSQSGILAFARRLGTASVAADIGGMSELASRTFPPGNVHELTAAIQAELESPSAVDPLAEDGLAVISHLRAYAHRRA